MIGSLTGTRYDTDILFVCIEESSVPGTYGRPDCCHYFVGNERTDSAKISNHTSNIVPYGTRTRTIIIIFWHEALFCPLSGYSLIPYEFVLRYTGKYWSVMYRYR